ncbi:MAG: transposase [Pyrinomonadaceae bacterium]
MKPFGEDWDYGDFPLAYLITFRTYGSWLHGDKRRSVDTHRGQNKFRSSTIKPNAKLEAKMARNMGQQEFTLNREMRRVVVSAIKAVCQHRGYQLLAINVRSNHVHIVVSGQMKPEAIADAFKSYATRELRSNSLIAGDLKPWARGRSRRYLWKESHVERAIAYVLYEQGDTEFDMGE